MNPGRRDSLNRVSYREFFGRPTLCVRLPRSHGGVDGLLPYLAQLRCCACESTSSVATDVAGEKVFLHNVSFPQKGWRLAGQSGDVI